MLVQMTALSMESGLGWLEKGRVMDRKGRLGKCSLTSPLEQEIIHIRGFRVCRRRILGQAWPWGSQRRFVVQKGGGPQLPDPGFLP